MPGARTTLAAEAMPDGKAWYRAQILQYTTLDMEPAAIHADGPQGPRLLFVAMTRAVQRLVLLHAMPPPAALATP